MDIKKYNFSFIPYLNWSFISKEEAEKYSKGLEFPKNIEILAADDLGDYILKIEGKIYVIDHSDIESKLCIGKSNEKFWNIIKKISELPNDVESIKDLKTARKAIKKLKKKSPKKFKFMLEDLIEDLKDDIWDLKNEIPEGNFYMETINVRDQLNKLLNRPKNYIEIGVEGNKTSDRMQIYGWCTKPNESVEEVKNAISKLESRYPIEILFLKSFEEFQKGKA